MVYSPARVAVLMMVVAAAFLTGCTRFSNTNQGGRLPPTPVNPAPTPNVEATNLDPATPETPTDDTALGTGIDQQKPVDVAAAAPADGGKEVTREALIGAWTVSTSGSNCQIFLALTKWSGGYRAASRGCSAAAISDVQAWDVKGKQVVLVDSGGNTAARLYRSAETRYDGSTTSGGAISFTR